MSALFRHLAILQHHDQIYTQQEATWSEIQSEKNTGMNLIWLKNVNRQRR